MIPTKDLPVDGLQPYHRNPRTGNTDAIAASLAASGQYRAIVVNQGTLTGRDFEVLAGNHTLAAARHLGWETITAHLVDVDDETARRIVIADNRTADLGGYDADTLAALLSDMESLDGTGYTPDDLADLFNSISAFDAGGSPDDALAEAGETERQFCITIQCASEDERQHALSELRALGFDCESPKRVAVRRVAP